MALRYTTMGPLLRRLLQSGVRAITLPPFGVYIRDGYQADLRIQKHEAVHWAQYERMGLLRFYTTYVWYSWTYGYWDNPMEVEAREQSEAL